MQNNIYIKGIKLKREIPSDNYLSHLDVIKHLKNMDMLEFNKQVTFLVGDNGVGKSTLIEAIAINYGFNPEGGTRNYNFKTKRTHSALCDYITLVKTPISKTGYFLRAESFYNTLSYLDYIYEEQYTDRDYFLHLKENDILSFSRHDQSHGESFLSTIEDFMGNGLYIFDEPEAALSPTGILKLISLIHNLENKNSQFIISTHSPMLLAYPNALIYEITGNGITPVKYNETMHYTLTRRFLEKPDEMLNLLLDKDN